MLITLSTVSRPMASPISTAVSLRARAGTISRTAAPTMPSSGMRRNAPGTN
jgi:hypothetical protein